MKKSKLSYTAGGNVKRYSQVEKSMIQQIRLLSIYARKMKTYVQTNTSIHKTLRRWKQADVYHDKWISRAQY